MTQSLGRFKELHDEIFNLGIGILLVLIEVLGEVEGNVQSQELVVLWLDELHVVTADLLSQVGVGNSVGSLNAMQVLEFAVEALERLVGGE